MKLNFFHTLKALWMARVKLRCIMGCPGLKDSYRKKGLFIVLWLHRLRVAEMLLLSLYLPIIILPLFFRHKQNIVFSSLIYEFLFLNKVEIFIFFRIYIFYYDLLSAFLLGFMGGISNSIFIALLKLFVSGPYSTLFIRFYYMSDDG